MNEQQDDRTDKDPSIPVPLEYKRYESPRASHRLGKSLGSTAGTLLVFLVGAVVFLAHMFEEHKHSYLPSLVFGGLAVMALASVTFLKRREASLPFLLGFLVAAGVCCLVEGICFLAG